MHMVSLGHNELTHWGRDEMNNISQTTFSNVFSSMKMFEFRLKFHWSLFARVHLTIFQHWFRKWLGAVQATSHYLNLWWFVYRRIYASLGLNELIPFVCVSDTVKKTRDIETEEMLEELHGKIRELEKQNGMLKEKVGHLNSLWPGDAIWWHRSGSTLAQVMACCLISPSYYLNKCWLIVNGVLWHSAESNLTWMHRISVLDISLKSANLQPHLRGINELRWLCLNA